MAERRNWTEDETILAFYYYCQIPFGKIHHSNPEIIRIANLLGRTPSAVVFKMGNLGHFDPSLRSRNVNGLSNGSKQDAAIVAQFLSDWESLALRAKQIEAKLQNQSVEQLIGINLDDLPDGSDRAQVTSIRVNQNFFRSAVLNAYDSTCCITGINTSTLLIASHIKPWAVSDHKTERTNPCNGLCLNALHDKAFDKGLITVLPDYTIRVSSHLKGDDSGTAWLRACDHQKIHLPHKFVPNSEFLEYHNDIIFLP